MNAHHGPVDAADVYKGDVLAAELRRTSDGVVFQYREDYLAGGLPPIATTLPLAAQPLLRPGGGVPAFFAGLLPEGRRLSSLRRAVKTSADDELSLLAAIGADTIGDVRVVPQGTAPQQPRAAIEVARDWAAIDFTEVLEHLGIDAVGLPGVQDKVSLRMISVPVARAGRHYLLKLDPPEYPHVVANEAYFLGVARRARIPVAQARLVRDGKGRPGLLVERFDRIANVDGTTARLPMEDAAQVLDLYPADKYAVSAESACNALADLCPARAVAARDLFRQVLFAWLTGNGDQHAKNLSVLAANGEWRVAPMYDVPSTVPYGDTRTALTLNGRTDGFSTRGMLAFAENLGLPERAAQAVVAQVMDATGPVISELEAGALPFGHALTRDLVRVLRFRRKALD